MNTMLEMDVEYPPPARDGEFAHCVCLVDGAHGIYVPQRFAQRFGEAWGIGRENLRILRAGPNHPAYWDAWDEVLASAACEQGGWSWRLWQDGDLFAVVHWDD